MSSKIPVSHELVVPDALAGRRLDQALAELLPDYSRSRLKSWIEAGEVRLQGLPARPRDRVLGGEQVTIEASIDAEGEVLGEPIELSIAYEDEHLLVVDKPAGLVVHPGAGNPSGTLQNALIHFDDTLATLPRSGIVHRLDKDTSGLLVIARSIPAHTALVRMLEARQIEREYQAVCVGVMTAGGTVDAPIARHPVDRLRMTVRDDGRESITHYRVIARYRAHTHVRLKLETGRTHQIRVHMAHIRYPIVGDSVYGGRLLLPRGATPELVAALRGFKRQALHAARLAFDHPLNGERIELAAPLPDDFSALLGALERDQLAVADRPAR
jgi:23S rRNA pseudouridine1911/1915/1917 synthase